MEVNDCLTVLTQLQGDGQSYALALDCLVEQFSSSKTNECIMQLLSHNHWSEVLKTLFKELKSLNLRLAGSAAYVIGLLSETDLGQLRLQQATPDYPEFISDFIQLLNCDDNETIMNAVGALGILVEAVKCREWLLGQQELLSKGVTLLSCLLPSKHLWTSSNAALVIARLCSSEDGCQFLLNHPEWNVLTAHLIENLGGKQQGCGTNSAIVLGRFVDVEPTRECLLKMKCIQHMIDGLEKMLANREFSVKKNACYCVSCLILNKLGIEEVLRHPKVSSLLDNVTCLISSNDTHACQLAVMTLYSLVNDSNGRTKVREIKSAQATLEAAYHNPSLCNDIKEQIASILQLMVDLPQPQSPRIQCTSPYTLTISWQASDVNMTLNAITYELWNESKIVYCGPDCCHMMSGLIPLTTYSIRLRLKIGENVSAFSPDTTATTAKAAPGAPQNVTIIGRTQTQVKLRWDPPEAETGSLKGYKVLVDGAQLLCKPVKSNSCIISGLKYGSTHQFEVMAVTSHGDGDAVLISGGPLDYGNQCPPKPQLRMLGRHEIFVSWLPPVQPMGRIMKYELKQDGQVVYSGIELQYKCKRLTPHTEYTFTVCVVTTEGRFESLPTKKRTAQDFCLTRAKLLRVQDKVKSCSGNDGLKPGSGYGLQSSRRPQSQSGLIPNVSLIHDHLQASDSLPKSKTNTTLQPLSKAKGTAASTTRRTVHSKSARAGFHCQTKSRQPDTSDTADSAARCNRFYEGLASLVEKSQHHSSRQKEKSNSEKDLLIPVRASQQMTNITCRDVRHHEQQAQVTPKAAAVCKQSNERLLVLRTGLRHYNDDELLTRSDGCATLLTSIPYLPRSTIPSGKDGRQPSRQQKQMSATSLRKGNIHAESFSIGMQHCPLNGTSTSSQSAPVIGTQTEISRQRQRGNCRVKLVAQASLPFTPSCAYIPKPLPIHLRKQHQHPLHTDHMAGRFCEPKSTNHSQIKYITQYRPVEDMQWHIQHSRLPITPTAAKSSF